MSADTNFYYQQSRVTLKALWKQLGSSELIGMPIFWLSILLYFPSTMWADPQKFGGGFSQWAGIFVVGHTVFWLTLKAANKTAHKYSDWTFPRPLLNFSIILAGVSARFFVVLVLINSNFPELESQWIVSRIGAGVATATILYISGGLLTISRAQHIDTVNRLNIAADHLDRQRLETVEIIQQTEAQLTETARRTLLPQLDEIRGLVSNTKSRDQLIENIRATIRNNVKPLSLELHHLAINIEPMEERREIVKARLAVIPKRIPLRNAMWPVFGFIVIFSWIVFAYRSMNADSLIPHALIYWSFYPIIVLVIKRLIPRLLEVGPTRGITVLLVTHYLGSVPFFYEVLQHIPAPQSYEFIFVTYFISGAIFLTLANISVIVTEQRRVEAELAAINSELRHELRLLDQKLWIARRNWSSLIHGPVQSSLTVALFKLQNTKKKIDDQVIDSLNHLNSLLEHGPDVSTPIMDGLNAIRNTWDGVCRFQFHVPEEVKVLLENNAVASDCVLEIATEIVGNAYRHGGARWVTFNLNFNHYGDLDISSQNDGSLSKSTSGSGLGSKMLDEVTLFWDLKRKSSTSLTEFSAVLPIQN